MATHFAKKDEMNGRPRGARLGNGNGNKWPEMAGRVLANSMYSKVFHFKRGSGEMLYSKGVRVPVGRITTLLVLFIWRARLPGKNHVLNLRGITG